MGCVLCLMEPFPGALHLELNPAQTGKWSMANCCTNQHRPLVQYITWCCSCVDPGNMCCHLNRLNQGNHSCGCCVPFSRYLLAKEICSPPLSPARELYWWCWHTGSRSEEKIKHGSALLNLSSCHLNPAFHQNLLLDRPNKDTKRMHTSQHLYSTDTVPGRK